MKIPAIRLNKRETVIVILTLLSPLLFLVGFIIWQSKNSIPGQYFFEIRKKGYFHGTIESIYRQKNNHNVMTIVNKDQQLGVERSWESKFQLGDSVSKNAGSLLVELYRDGKLIEVLDYNDIARERRHIE